MLPHQMGRQLPFVFLRLSNRYMVTLGRNRFSVGVLRMLFGVKCLLENYVVEHRCELEASINTRVTH